MADTDECLDRQDGCIYRMDGWWMNGAMDRGMDGCMMDEVTSTDG